MPRVVGSKGLLVIDPPSQIRLITSIRDQRGEQQDIVWALNDVD
jgi:hypothetical protein